MQSPELTAAIDGLYDAFAGYPRPATFLACGCCWKGREIPGANWQATDRPVVEVASPGADRPLRTAEPDAALAELATDVPLTGGDLALFKHYLPRLLEITAGVGFADDDPELFIITSHLSLEADVGAEPWWTWPGREQEAVQAFLDAAWRTARRGTTAETDDTLGAVAVAVPAIQPYLDAWTADLDENAAANLVEFTGMKQSALANSERYAFWWWTPGNEPGATNYTGLVDWLNARPSP